MQIEALNAFGCERVYSETKSGKNANREQFKLMVEHLRGGDIVVVHSLSRIGRNLKDILRILDDFRERNIEFVSITEGIRLDDSATGKLIINVFGMLAQLQRDLTRDKTIAGLEAARRRGRVGGRPTGLSEKAKKIAKTAAVMYKSRDYSVREICNTLDIAQSTLYKYLRHEKVRIGGVYRKAVNSVN